MESANFQTKMWPPSQSTRLMLVEKMVKNLVAPSILSRKYGLLSLKEAQDEAKKIEAVAFAAATQHFMKEPEGDGSSAVKLYAKESSRLMVDLVKRGPSPDYDREVNILVKIKESDATVFDISGDPRIEISASDAAKLLKPLSEPGNRYTKICLSNTSFGLDAAHVAGPVLSSIADQLTEVDLSDFVARREENEALEVMKVFSLALERSKLKYLDFSHNALGEKGIRAFGDLLRSQHDLEELYLMNDGISEEAAQALHELIPSTDKLRVLHFHNNMTGDDGAIAISKLVKKTPLLEDFRCSSTRIGSEGGIALAEALEKCSHLKKLDLSDNIFGVEAGIPLSKIFSTFSDLTEICLSYLNLEDEGSIAVANALKESAPSLEVLELAGNEITGVAASALAACIASKQFLAKLNLAENELKDEGAIMIAKVLDEGHGQLCEVDMSVNAIRRAGARCLAQAVVNKPGFKMLNINGNYISDDGVDEVKNVFKNFPSVLGPLDDNDPEGEDYDDGSDEQDGDAHDELESRLKGLDIKQKE